MKRHLTYANVAATIALVLAMSGGAIAATHYLINSTKQINPKVIRKLKGNAGPRGVQGLQGPRGLQGVPGRMGATLESGQTITGSFAAQGQPGQEGGHLVASISYPAAATNPIPGVALYGQPIPGCPGSASAPSAEKGHLCIYVARASDVPLTEEVKGVTGSGGDFRYGAALFMPAGGMGCKTCEPEILGTWAYTAQ
jgi:hypothetical protein